MYNNLSHQSHNIYRKHSARISFFCVVEKDMPFVIPYYKKPAKLRERYKTVETYQAFDLQVLKRGKPSISRPLCRILVRAFDRTFIRRQHSRSHSKRSRICYRMFRRRSGKSRGQSSRVRSTRSQIQLSSAKIIRHADFEPRNGTTAQRNFQRWSPEM